MQQVVLILLVGNYHCLLLITQKSAVLSYFAAEASNHVSRSVFAALNDRVISEL